MSGEALSLCLFGGFHSLGHASFKTCFRILGFHVKYGT